MQASVLRAGPKLTVCAALPAGMPYPSNLDAGIPGPSKRFTSLRGWLPTQDTIWHTGSASRTYPAICHAF